MLCKKNISKSLSNAKYLKHAIFIFVLSFATVFFFSLPSYAESKSFELSKEEKAYIKQSEPIKVAYDAFWPPFESYNKDKGILEGINYEILMLISKLTGLEFEFVHELSYADALKSLAKGEVDMHLSYDTNPKKAKEFNGILSNTFLSTPIAILGKNYEITDNCVFAISALHPIIIDFVKETFPRNKILIFQDIESAYREIEAGRANFTLENVYAARKTIIEGDYPLLHIVSVLPLYDNLSFLFSKNVDPLLISIFNKAIASFPKSQFTEILLQHTIQPSFTSQFFHTLAFWSADLLIALIILLIILITSLAFYSRQQKKLKEKMHIKQQQVQNLLDAFPMPIYISDLESYKILYCNKAIHNAFDTSQMKTKTCYEILQNTEEPCSFCTNEQIVQLDEPYTWNHHNPLLSKTFQIIDSCVTWDSKAKVRLSIAIDITKTLELEKEKIIEQEANQAKGQFLANMSHELRTPLNGILGMTHLAIDTNKSEQVAGYLSKIQTSSKNLLSIINDILDFSKIESGKVEFENKAFSLQKILFDIEANLLVVAQRKGLELSHYIDPALPEYVMGDPLRLSQVIFNIAGNAIKFTEKGSVSIKMYKNELVLSEKIGIRLVIADTGIGISDEQMPRLFAEFSQADSSTSRCYGGTGLGLAISKRLTNLMGGDILVKSEFGKGSEFECTFAFSPALETDEIIIEREESIDCLQNVRVLLAEDNEINRMIATELLEKLGCIVTCAVDGLEVLSILENESFDVILMDIQMPNLDGLQTSKKIRENRLLDTLPIIAVSAHAMLEDRQKSLSFGMQEHISKPFDPQTLYRVIDKYVSSDFAFDKPLEED